MNKKGLVGMILIIAIIVLMALGTLMYYQIKKHGLQIISGNIVVDLNYQNEQKNSSNGTISIKEENSPDNQSDNASPSRKDSIIEKLLHK